LFKGALPHEDIPTYLNAADVFVLPTLAEGCSNAIVEAMACGLPIISSNLPFNWDLLNAENAILVDPMSVEQIATGIEKLLNHPALQQQMSLSALATVKDLTIEKRVRSILQFFQQCEPRINVNLEQGLM
jgi:glycosyltransferase involved in cell wall biosynthesis